MRLTLGWTGTNFVSDEPVTGTNDTRGVTVGGDCGGGVVVATGHGTSAVVVVVVTRGSLVGRRNVVAEEDILALSSGSGGVCGYTIVTPVCINVL